MMTNGQGDRTRETPLCHRGFDHVGMIGARAPRTSSGPAAMHRPHQQAVYMTAPETPPSKVPLATGGRPYMTRMTNTGLDPQVHNQWDDREVRYIALGQVAEWTYFST